MKFNLPTIEELVEEKIELVKQKEDKIKSETNPIIKNLMVEDLEYHKSILNQHKQTIRSIMIDKLIDDN